MLNLFCYQSNKVPGKECVVRRLFDAFTNFAVLVAVRSYLVLSGNSEVNFLKQHLLQLIANLKKRLKHKGSGFHNSCKSASIHGLFSQGRTFLQILKYYNRFFLLQIINCCQYCSVLDKSKFRWGRDNLEMVHMNVVPSSTMNTNGGTEN